MDRIRRNYFDLIYSHKLRIRIRDDLFEVTTADANSLGDALKVDLTGHEASFSTIFASFANAVTNDVLIGRRLHLSNYLKDLASSAERLIKLIEEPIEISDDYPLVHYHLVSNWDQTKSPITAQEIGRLANRLRILRADALRIREDHSPETRSAGRKQYAARELLRSILAIAEGTGANMELAGTDSEIPTSKPLASFAATALQLAVSKGKEGVASLTKVPENFRAEIERALDNEQVLVTRRLTWHLRQAAKQ